MVPSSFPFDIPWNIRLVKDFEVSETCNKQSYRVSVYIWFKNGMMEMHTCIQDGLSGLNALLRESWILHLIARQATERYKLTTI